MEMDNKFDRALDIRFRHDSELYEVIHSTTHRTPKQLRCALCFVIDTLEICWLGSQTVFGNKAKPEHAFSALNTVLETLDRMPPPEVSSNYEIKTMPNNEFDGLSAADIIRFAQDPEWHAKWARYCEERSSS